MAAVLAILCVFAVLLCFRSGRKLLKLGLRLILSCATLALCPIGLNPVTLAVVFLLGIPGFLSLLAVYTLI